MTSKPPHHKWVGGKLWHADQAYLGGVQGRPIDVSGYWSGQSRAGAPRLTDISKRVVNVSKLRACYALKSGHTIEYAGEGKLGTELKKYWNDPLKQWDSFFWIAPAKYSVDDSGSAKVEESPATFPSTRGAADATKSAIEFLEMLVILAANPRANNQAPSRAGDVLWLKQTKAFHAEGSLRDQIKALHDRVS